MNQMKINDDDPVAGLKTLYARYNSVQAENDCLKQKSELLLVEMDMQRKQHVELLTEKTNYESNNISRLDIDITYTAESDDSREEDRYRPPIFRSSAQMARQKMVTVPSFENNSFYVVETEGGEIKEVDEKSFLGANAFRFGEEEHMATAEVVRIENVDFGEGRQKKEIQNKM